METELKIKDIVEPLIEKAGYKLLQAELKKKGKVYHLIIIIDKKEGVNIEDCARVSRLIGPFLEKENLIKVRYFLVVSSPGIK